MMCLCRKKPEPLMAPAKRRLLTFGINDYPGSYNDLNGCVNDCKDFREFFYAHGFECHIYTNEQVTKNIFRNTVNEAIGLLRPDDVLYIHYSGHGTQVPDRSGDEGNGYDEALYLYDDVLVDDEFNTMLSATPQGATVVVFLDCCFSATATRTVYHGKVKKNRYMRLSANPIPKKKKRKNIASNWITFSACGEWQTAADAYFNGRPNGAFSHYLLLSFCDNSTYLHWYNRLRKFLPSMAFSQIPEIEGNATLLNKIVLT